ncbi:unnamed protein product, partial [Brassica rapa subsp. narinosa]
NILRELLIQSIQQGARGEKRRANGETKERGGLVVTPQYDSKVSSDNLYNLSIEVSSPNDNTHA